MRFPVRGGQLVAKLQSALPCGRRPATPHLPGEMAFIVDQGVCKMLGEQRDVFYYAMLMSENYAQPDLPHGVEPDVVRVCYQFESYSRNFDEGYGHILLKEATLMGFGVTLTEVIKAAHLLAASGVICRPVKASGSRLNPEVTGSEQPDQTDHDQVDGHDVVQQAGRNQNEDSRKQRNDGSKTDGNVHWDAF